MCISDDVPEDNYRVSIFEVLDACCQVAFQKAEQVDSVISRSSTRFLASQALKVARHVGGPIPVSRAVQEF